jgi:hypothetical protein
MFDKIIYEGLHIIMKYAGALNAWAWRKHAKILESRRQTDHGPRIRDQSL